MAAWLLRVDSRVLAMLAFSPRVRMELRGPNRGELRLPLGPITTNAISYGGASVSRRVDPSWRRSLALQQAVPLADQPLERDRARRDCTPGRFGTSEVPNLTRIRRVRLTQTTRGRFGTHAVLNLPVVADLRCRHANKTCPDGQTVVCSAGSSV